MDKLVLIADDEKEIVELLSLYLEKENYKVIGAYSGFEAWEKINKQSIDIAILDIMMPDLNGFELVKKIRQEYNIPIIFLSARDGDHDKILGLGLGADDYITKPFNPLEVVARIQAQLRRFYDLNQTSEKGKTVEQIAIGELILCKENCTLYMRGQEVPLTSIEYKMVALLMERAGKVFTKKQIFEEVWKDFFVGDDNTIMVHISKIREKIEPVPKHPVYIKTIRGLGYKFEKKVEHQ